MIGLSMISPEGLAIRPRMAASCFIWAGEPRAPEWLIMKIEFTGLSRPFSSFCTEEMRFIISPASRSEHFAQASTTLLYFSPWVIRPSWYCCS